MSDGIKIVYGGATIQDGRAFGTAEGLKEVMKMLKDNGVTTIDTAQIYGESETIIGQAKAGSSFTIDTKAAGGFKAGTATKDGITNGAKESLKKIGVDKVGRFELSQVPQAVLSAYKVQTG